eukprot:6175274-Alexandrium_andersonii.AAC.1
MHRGSSNAAPRLLKVRRLRGTPLPRGIGGLGGIGKRPDPPPASLACLTSALKHRLAHNLLSSHHGSSPPGA